MTYLPSKQDHDHHRRGREEFEARLQQLVDNTKASVSPENQDPEATVGRVVGRNAWSAGFAYATKLYRQQGGP